MDVERPGGEELIELLGGASIILCNSTYCRRVLGLVLVEEEGGGAGGVEEEEEEREIVANSRVIQQSTCNADQWRIK